MPDLGYLVVTLRGVPSRNTYSSFHGTRKGRMSKAARLAVIIVIGLALFGVPAALRIVGERAATREVLRIRAATEAARVDTSKLLAPMFDAQAQSPVAASLGIDTADVSLKQHDAGWCAEIRVHRLLAEQRVFLSMAADGRLRPVGGC